MWVVAATAAVAAVAVTAASAAALVEPVALAADARLAVWTAEEGRARAALAGAAVVARVRAHPGSGRT